MKTIQSSLDGHGLKLGIAVSRFNKKITQSLLDGALSTLKDQGVSEDDIVVAWVPGAFELPLTAQTMAATKEFDAILCLGAVIRGATSHYDYICLGATHGILEAGLRANIPIIFGVLTTQTVAHAEARSKGEGNKGSECALNAIEMVRVLKKIKG